MCNEQPPPQIAQGCGSGRHRKNTACFAMKNGSRFFRNDFFIAIMIAISTGKTLIDFAGKNAE